jgi:hypothetical protein
MNRRLLLILGLITAGAVLLAIVTGRDRPDPEASGSSAELVPGLSHAINQVERIRLTAPEGDGVITIVRHRDGWTVSERDGYPVDAGQVRQLLIRLSEARTLEEKTADPAFYERLGVEDVTAENGSGVLVEIEGGADAALIVGKQEPRSGRGTYVRPREAAGSLLVDQTLDPGTRVADWVIRDIVDIPETAVSRLEVRHADGDVVEVLRDETGAFVLGNRPEGRELSAASGPATLARTLTGLRLDDVRASQEAEPPEDATTARFVTDDGRALTARLWQRDDSRLLTMNVSRAEPDNRPEESGPESGSDQDHEPDRAAGTPEPTGADPGDGPAQVTDAELRAQDERLSGWTYTIPVWKYDQINRRLEDLLAPAGDSEDG